MLYWALFVSERTNERTIIIHSHRAPQATSRSSPPPCPPSSSSSFSWRPSRKGGIKREREKVREDERGAASGLKASGSVTRLRGLEACTIIDFAERTDGLKLLGTPSNYIPKAQGFASQRAALSLSLSVCLTPSLPASRPSPAPFRAPPPS